MKLEAVPMELRDANEFVANYHRHNKPVVGHRFSIGAVNGEALVGVAIIGRPIARKNQDGFTAEVTRTCVKPDAPKGTNSFLYACAWRAWRAMGGHRLITYTLESESGASLRGAGWKVVGQVAPAKQGAWGCEKLGRVRAWQPIFGQKKIKWEALPDEVKE